MRCLYTTEVKNFIKKYERIYIVEANRDGQLRQILSSVLPDQAPKFRSACHSDGLAFNCQMGERCNFVSGEKDYDHTGTATQTNKVGLTKNDYRGLPSTLCQGCGHNSIANQIITVCYDLDIVPEEIIKFSGIGCSSKSPAYFLNRSFGFNGLHGRMSSFATGAMFADTSLRSIGISGDGDTASIGMGGFKHLVRRNAPIVYIVENNGVYGLTKGQFSATAEVGLNLKHQGINQYMPVDICLEALASNATFVARSFAGDAKQVKEF